jgi:hypothetical protein
MNRGSEEEAEDKAWAQAWDWDAVWALAVESLESKVAGAARAKAGAGRSPRG